MSDVPNGPGSLSLAFVEGLYETYLADPGAVPTQWREYFDAQRDDSPPPSRLGPSFPQRSIFNPPQPYTNGHALPQGDAVAYQQHRVDEMIRAYRARGHMIAHLDPLQLPRPRPAELDPSYYGFTEADMDRPFSTATMSGAHTRPLREILEVLYTTYCRFIGAQFMHIDDLEVRKWLQDRMEGCGNRLKLPHREQIRILTRLTDAVIFEEFIQKKFLGAKSFSLEGGESLIPLLGLALERLGDSGVEEVVIGMAHRGRLNVLANVLGKSPAQIFREFEDSDPDAHLGRGDVKYHLGYTSDWHTSAGRTVQVSLCFNPSHLEFVNTVVLGRVRAKQDRMGDVDHRRAAAILIHGDAAFAGEGVVQETLNLSQLKAYEVGGTVHVIVNNQIGFTTDPEESRSTVYATDVAKMLQIPIFHVNGEDSEAVAQVVRLALEFRQEFQRDVVIDMYCYRRRGHNEGDEPAFTQPLLYGAIERRKTVRQGYLGHLMAQGEVTREEADKIADERRDWLEQHLAEARSDEKLAPAMQSLDGIWASYFGGPADVADPVETTVDISRLRKLSAQLVTLPESFTPHPKLQRILRQRAEMAAGDRPADWALGEALAFATLASDGRTVRMSGQDAERGTFSHRHAVLHDVETGLKHRIFNQLGDDQAPVRIHNSPLCETGVLGFEYGYSLDEPGGLVVWEAQFGDFANCAQVIIDQFLVSAEDKWQRLSGLVMLLPHGFEGMGPEHSSARVERFLMLCAEDNIQVANVTTPAQLFHLLRRQTLRRWRKPLILFTPKSLLRHPRAVSSLDEFATGGFQPVLPDPSVAPGEVTQVLLCTGKIYYDLLERREQTDRRDTAILRLEQLYPIDQAALSEALAPYPAETPVHWVQEEPRNMGPWTFLRYRLGDRVLDRYPFDGLTRPESASPATGSGSAHKLEQERILNAALGSGSPVAPQGKP